VNRWLWPSCVATALSCVWLGTWVVCVATDRVGVFPHLVDGMWLQSLLVAMPFAALALHARVHRTLPRPTPRAYTRAAVAGVAVSALAWGWFHWNVYEYWTHRPGTGADMGLGCVMLLSPGIVLATMLVVARIERRVELGP